MTDHRLTAQTAELTDAAILQPEPGTRVLALTIGGVLVSTVWRSDSAMHFDAWAPFPKVPRTVKERQLGRLN